MNSAPIRTDPQVFFEAPDVRNDGKLLVGERHSHYDDGQQPGLRLDHVRQGECDDHDRQGHRGLQVVGYPVPAHDDHDPGRCDAARRQAHAQRLQEVECRAARRRLKVTGRQSLEDEDRQDDADGVDYDALPVEDRGDPASRSYVAQERPDDRRTAHQYHAAE